MYPSKRLLLTSLLALMLASPIVASAQDGAMKPSDTASEHASVPKELVGAWVLVSCDNVYPDVHRVDLYGPHPEGMWLIDAQGDVRHVSFGEGDYPTTEKLIRQLLQDASRSVRLPAATDVPNLTPGGELSPETYVG